MQVALIALLSALVAYANGANDISKGIATLVGSGLASYRGAILWGTAWTALGAVAASVFAGAMLATFGAGLLADGITPSFPAAAAALAGAGAWVVIATRASLPVSTTHALVGAMIGAGVSAYGLDGIAWSALATKIALPLLVSPVAAVLLTRGLSRIWTGGFGPARATADCVCVSADTAPNVQWGSSSTAALSRVSRLEFSLAVGDAAGCQTTQPTAWRVTGDHLHWLSSGAVSFARGLNDAPKIVGLAWAAMALASTSLVRDQRTSFLLVTGGIVAGSLIAGRCVTRALAEDVTPMGHRDGLVANLVTASLVTAGAVYGLPMSTTQVSAGGIMGIGAERGSLNWRTVRGIALAWILTVPAAAAYAVARW